MTEHSTRPDERFGHRVLDPMPTQEELETFYRDTYYTLVDEGRRAADIARCLLYTSPEPTRPY